MPDKILNVGAEFISDGFAISIEDKKFQIIYPAEVWAATPASVKSVLLENLTFGNTHFLPLLLDKNKIKYNLNYPLLESFFYRNQLNDLLCCEKSDEVPHLSYLKKFYNLNYEFTDGESSLPVDLPKIKADKPKAILPFTFGRESVTTFALCRELGIEPILIYFQEPAHPFEEEYKVKKLQELADKYQVKVHFMKNEIGLVRYGLAFGLTNKSEIGWGCQTTLLALLSVPYIYYYQAQYVLMGNEYLNNAFEMKNDWKLFYSYDQNSFWTHQQNNMVRILTGGQAQVKSSLEPLDEINIFYLLHKRYPDIGKFQFSCHAKHPLVGDSQWCMQCTKCERNFIFATCIGLDPRSIGFSRNILEEAGHFSAYFDPEADSDLDLDFSFYLLHKRGLKNAYVEKFAQEKLPKIQDWSFYHDFATQLKNAENLPADYADKMKTIFNEELQKFNREIPAK